MGTPPFNLSLLAFRTFHLNYFNFKWKPNCLVCVLKCKCEQTIWIKNWFSALRVETEMSSGRGTPPRKSQSNSFNWIPHFHYLSFHVALFSPIPPLSLSLLSLPSLIVHCLHRQDNVLIKYICWYSFGCNSGGVKWVNQWSDTHTTTLSGLPPSFVPPSGGVVRARVAVGRWVARRHPVGIHSSSASLAAG